MEHRTHLFSEDDLQRIVALMRISGVDLQRYEVKASRKGLAKDIGRTLSAFSNGTGGIIICGLSEENDFAPIDGFEVKATQDALATYCNEKMTPPVRPEIQVLLFEGKPVIVADIPEMRPSDKPCYVTASRQYDGAYIRTGDGDRRLLPYEVDRLLDERKQPRHDYAVVEESSLEDLNPILVNGLLERERRIHARNFARISADESLVKLGAAAKGPDGRSHPTLAGLMALGDYPQQFFPRLNVSFACYPGTSKSNADEEGQRMLDSATMVGPIPFMVEDAIAAITRNMRIGAIFEGAFRKDVPDYPIVALREAIANALMHRDYSSQSYGIPVQVDMYADRLEITNPGGLYGNVTLEMLGKDCISASRNQYLANLLESTPYADGTFMAENRGTGYQAIEAALSDALMPPPIPRSTIGHFSLAFSKRRITKSERRFSTGEAVTAVILGLLAEQNSISTSEVIKHSGKSRATVVKYINKLVAEEKLEPIEPAGSTKQRYRLLLR